MAEKIASLYAEISADTTKLKKGLTESKTGLDGAADKLSKFRSSSLAAWGAIGGAVVGFGAVIKSTMDKTVAYAKQVREVSDFTGMTVEETSRLIQVADDWGIEAGQVRQAMQMMTKNGMKPGIESLADLADEFVSTTDKTEFAEKASKLLGRQWTTLIPILKQGGNALRDQAAGVDKNLVVTEEMIVKAREYELALDAWQEQSEKLVYHWGTELLPKGAAVLELLTEMTSLEVDGWFNQGADAAANFINQFFGGKDAIEETGSAAEKFAAEDFVGKLGDMGDAATRTWGEFYKLGGTVRFVQTSMDDLRQMMSTQLGDEMEDYSEREVDMRLKGMELREEIEKLSKPRYLTDEQKIQLADMRDGLEQVDAKIKKLEDRKLSDQQKIKLENLRESSDKLRESISKLEGQKYLTAAQKEELNKLQTEYKENQAAYQEASAEHQKATKQILYDILAQRAAVDGLTQAESEALLKVAESWGLIDEDTAGAMKAADEFFRSVNDGAVVSEQKIMGLDSAMRGLPTTHDFTINVKVNQRKGVIYDESGDPVGETPTVPGWDPGQTPGGASGLSMIVPPGFSNDSYYVRASSGESVNISPSGQGGMGDVYVVQNFYDQGAAALGMAYVDTLRGSRLDASMGR